MKQQSILMWAMVAVTIIANPIVTHADLTLSAWNEAQTDKYYEGLWPVQSSSSAGRVEWIGNSLFLEYRKEFGTAAWANNFNVDYFVNPIPAPGKAVGIAFDVVSTSYPSYWAVALDLGTYAGGISTGSYWDTWTDPSEAVTYNSGLETTFFQPLIYQFDGTTWSVQTFFPDIWLFRDESVMWRLDFFATTTFSGSDWLVDGTTEFRNVSWILSDPFPEPVPQPIPDPNVIPIPSAVILGSLGLAFSGLKMRKCKKL